MYAYRNTRQNSIKWKVFNCNCSRNFKYTLSRQPGYHIVTFQSRQNQPVPMAYPGKSKNEKDAKKSKKNGAMVSSPPSPMNASIQYPV